MTLKASSNTAVASRTSLRGASIGLEPKVLVMTCGVSTLLDRAVFDEIPSRGWHVNNHGYAIRQARVDGKKKNTLLHHLVLPPIKGLDVDHINRNKLDNRRCNLRYATRAQNIYNMGEKRNNTSGYKGVSWDKRTRKWRAYIGGSVSRTELGLFDNKVDAIMIRFAAEEQLV